MKEIIQLVLARYDLTENDLLRSTNIVSVAKTCIVQITLRTTSYSGKEIAQNLGVSTSRISQMRNNTYNLSMADKRFIEQTVSALNPEHIKKKISSVIYRANIDISEHQKTELIDNLIKAIQE